MIQRIKNWLKRRNEIRIQKELEAAEQDRKDAILFFALLSAGAGVILDHMQKESVPLQNEN